MSGITIGTMIYYTGDMANQPGHFRITEASQTYYTLTEIEGGEGRVIRGVFDRHIGREYHGHCNPRFVTAEARSKYSNACAEELKRAAHRAVYLTKERA